MEHKGSSGFHSLLGQTESFNYPQRVCTVAYGVGYSPSLFVISWSLLDSHDVRSHIFLRFYDTSMTTISACKFAYNSGSGDFLVSYPDPSYSAALGVLHHQHAEGIKGLETLARFSCANGMQSNVKSHDM